MTAEISILGLILEASLLVKMVMLTLMGMSVVSWAMIIKRSKVLSQASKQAEVFEDKFWSGVDLAKLYQESNKRKDELSGTEEIFMQALLNLLAFVNQTQRLLTSSWKALVVQCA